MIDVPVFPVCERRRAEQSRAERLWVASRPSQLHMKEPLFSGSLSAAVEKHRPGPVASERRDNSGERSESRLAESTHSSASE